MTIVIPMAGHSRRFKAMGYETPKAFIEIDGIPMIHWVCRMFSPNDKFVFVALNTHLEVDHYKKILQSATPNYEIIGIDTHEKGPVYTSLFADDVIADSEPVIVSYCDGFQHWNYQRFLMKVADYEGGLTVFRGHQFYMVDTPASFGDTYYAYVRANDQLEMLELREKQSFTDIRHDEYASTGVYYVSHWGLYKEYAKNLLETGLPVGNEYYVSLLYNPLIQDGKRVILFEVDKFICWGTPEDLEEYKFWSEYFGRDIKHIQERSLS